MMDPKIATSPEDTSDFLPGASLVTYYYRILPNNNPRYPKGFAPLVWNGESSQRQRDRCKVVTTTWGNTSESEETARALAVASALDDAKHYIGPWNIRVVEWERRGEWGITL